MDFYKILSIASPFVSAFLAGLLTYYFTLKTKKFDILYQNKIPAFKEMVSKLIGFKKFCNGRIAYFIGNEYSPYYEEGLGTLEHRSQIAESYDLNSIFLCEKSRVELDNLIDNMGILANVEASIASGNIIGRGIEEEYERVVELIDTCIDTLYKDLNLK
jgi:hypothetical protein